MGKVTSILFKPAGLWAMFMFAAGLFSAMTDGRARINKLAAPVPYGVWLAKDGKAQVKLRACDNALCSRISWLQQPVGENGKPMRDIDTANAGLRHREIPSPPILSSPPIQSSLPILSSMTKSEDGIWKGQVYDPEQGRNLTAYIRVISVRTLEFKGCISETNVCQTSLWSRLK